ncbi:MAG TPA: hypothetical protein DCG69_11415 [Bacteroidales bacterium]|nr:hypothetical protein [Bacteroidales bacterium]
MILRFGFLFLMFSCFSLSAQNQLSNSKKAVKYFQEARTEYALGNPIPAELLLLKALNIDKNFCEAYFFTADIKAELGYPLDAIEYYKKGLAIDSHSFPKEHFYLAKLFLQNGFYEEALHSFQTFLQFESQSETLRNEAAFQQRNCLFALEALKNPDIITLKNLGSNINSDRAEYFPTLSVDNQFLLYTRRLPRETKGEQEDFVGALSLNDSAWKVGIPIYDLNTPYNEGAASLSADGKTLVFSACESFGEYGAGRSGFGSCDLFFVRKIGDHWTKVVNMGKPINSANWETQPSLSSDGKSIYFVRAPKNAAGSADIFRSDLDENGFWKEPVKLSENVNTEKDEQSVFIHPDNQTLYFSSNGRTGMGGTDLFMSKWNSEKNDWDQAVNLGFPINTFKEESSILVSPNGKLAYFASDRKEGFGGLDLYSFSLPESVKPEKITYFKGVVFDAKTQELLSAQFELIELETGKQLAFSVSDRVDGSFLLTLNLKKDYILNVSRPGYLFYSDQFLLQKEYSTSAPFLKDIPLQAIGLGEKMILKNIFFDTDKADLKRNSEIELGKLVLFLNLNPTIHIEIMGHTDHVGTAEYNEKLSTQRAKAVYDFLVNHLIASSRLTYKGFGWEKPMADNETEAGRAQNRRTEFVVTKI